MTLIDELLVDEPLEGPGETPERCGCAADDQVANTLEPETLLVDRQSDEPASPTWCLSRSETPSVSTGFVDWRPSAQEVLGNRRIRGLDIDLSFFVENLDLTSPGLRVYENLWLSDVRPLLFRTRPGFEQTSVTGVAIGPDDYMWIVGFNNPNRPCKGLPWTIRHHNEVTSHFPAPLSDSSDDIDSWGVPLDYPDPTCFAGWSGTAGWVVAPTASGNEGILFSATTNGADCGVTPIAEVDLAIALSTDSGRTFGGARIVNTFSQRQVVEHHMVVSRDGTSAVVVWRATGGRVWLRVVQINDAAITFVGDAQEIIVPLAYFSFADLNLARIQCARISDGDVVSEVIAMVFASSAPPPCVDYSPDTGGSVSGATITWYFTYSTDQGRTWAAAEPIFTDADWPVCLAQGGSPFDDSTSRARNSAQPAFAYDDTIGVFYVAFARSRYGDRTKGSEIVVFRKSNQLRDIWVELFTSPVTTIDYRGATRNNDSFSPAIAAVNGQVAVSWHDTWESTGTYMTSSTYNSMLVSVFGAGSPDLGETWQISRLSNPRTSPRFVAPHEGPVTTHPTEEYVPSPAPEPAEFVPWNVLMGRWRNYDSIAVNPNNNQFFAAWGGDSRHLDPGGLVDLDLDGSDVWGVQFHVH